MINAFRPEDIVGPCRGPACPHPTCPPPAHTSFEHGLPVCCQCGLCKTRQRSCTRTTGARPRTSRHHRRPTRPAFSRHRTRPRSGERCTRPCRLPLRRPRRPAPTRAAPECTCTCARTSVGGRRARHPLTDGFGCSGLGAWARGLQGRGVCAAVRGERARHRRERACPATADPGQLELCNPAAAPVRLRAGQSRRGLLQLSALCACVFAC